MIERTVTPRLVAQEALARNLNPVFEQEWRSHRAYNPVADAVALETIRLQGIAARWAGLVVGATAFGLLVFDRKAYAFLPHTWFAVCAGVAIAGMIVLPAVSFLLEWVLRQQQGVDWKQLEEFCKALQSFYDWKAFTAQTTSRSFLGWPIESLRAAAKDVLVQSAGSVHHCESFFAELNPETPRTNLKVARDKLTTEDGEFHRRFETLRLLGVAEFEKIDFYYEIARKKAEAEVATAAKELQTMPRGMEMAG